MRNDYMDYSDHELLDVAYDMLRLARDAYGVAFLETGNATMEALAARVGRDVAFREPRAVCESVTAAYPRKEV